MATGDISPRSNSLSDIQNILSIFKGSGTTTQTNTSSETVSDDKAKAYLQQILESNSGLAAVSSGQKAAGMYNSTVNQQLTNDLLARASAQTAALSSTKTSTTTGQTGAQLNPLKTIGGMLAGQVLAPVVKTGSKKLGLDKLGDNISEAVFGDSSGSFAGFPVADAQMNAVTNAFPIGSVTPDFSTSINDIGNLSNAPASNMSTAGGFDAGSAMAATAGATAIGASLASAGAGTAAATGGGYVLGAEGATWAAADTAAAATTAVEGASILDTLGTVAAAIAWIICTELNKQGRLPYRYYIYGAREFAKYDERGKQGYYIWAIPSVKHLRKNPNSAYSKLMEVVFNARAEYLAAKAGCKGARKTVLGAVTTHGLYAFCWVLSRTIARKAYTKEQILNVGA